MKANRRDFIKSSVAASLALPGFPHIVASTTDKYRTALIGTGWWGMNIVHEALSSGTAKVVALCDVDENQLNPAAENVEKLSGERPVRYKDYRELLAKEKPDIVIVATPDHWHALITIAACEAGAHVYVEKPISHTITEGRAMVKAARANNRVVQVDLHRRVSPHNVSDMKFLKDGRAGKIGMVRAFVHYAGGPGEPTTDSEPPAGLDWNLWCGPAPMRPFNKAIHPKGFRQFLDYANGQLGDWGVHWMDQILWWTEEKYPRKVCATGGRWIKHDSTDAPDTQVVSSSSSRSPPSGSTASTPATKRRKPTSVATSTVRRGPSTWGGWTAGPSIPRTQRSPPFMRTRSCTSRTNKTSASFGPTSSTACERAVVRSMTLRAGTVPPPCRCWACSR